MTMTLIGSIGASTGWKLSKRGPVPNDEDDNDRVQRRTVRDELVRIIYTMNPTLYVDDDSTTTDLLWQQVLEQRATRYWIALGCGLITVLGVVALVILTAIAL